MFPGSPSVEALTSLIPLSESLQHRHGDFGALRLAKSCAISGDESGAWGGGWGVPFMTTVRAPRAPGHWPK
jgi:hypothetical protein